MSHSFQPQLSQQEYKLIFADPEPGSDSKTLEDRFIEQEVRAIFFPHLNPNRILILFGFLTGAAQHSGFSAAVPLWSLLLIRQTEGAGESQHCLDCRVRHAETEGQDTQLHSNLSGQTLAEPQE